MPWSIKYGTIGITILLVSACNIFNLYLDFSRSRFIMSSNPSSAQKPDPLPSNNNNQNRLDPAGEPTQKITSDEGKARLSELRALLLSPQPNLDEIGERWIALVEKAGSYNDRTSIKLLLGLLGRIRHPLRLELEAWRAYYNGWLHFLEDEWQAAQQYGEQGLNLLGVQLSLAVQPQESKSNLEQSWSWIALNEPQKLVTQLELTRAKEGTTVLNTTKAERYSSTQKLAMKLKVMIAAVLVHLNEYEQSNQLLTQLLNATCDDAQFVTVVDTLVQLGNLAFRQGELKEAQAYYQLSYQVAHLSQYDLGEAEALERLGQFSDNDFQTGRRNIEQAIEIYKRLGDVRDLGRVYTRLGLILTGQKLYTEANEALEVAGLLFHQLNNKNKLALVYTNLAINYNTVGRADLAQPIASKAVELYRPMPYPQRAILVFSLIELARSEEKLGQAVAARLHADEVELLLQESITKVSADNAASMKNNVGILLLSLATQDEQFDKALTLLKEAYNQYIELGEVKTVLIEAIEPIQLMLMRVKQLEQPVRQLVEQVILGLFQSWWELVQRQTDPRAELTSHLVLSLQCADLLSKTPASEEQQSQSLEIYRQTLAIIQNSLLHGQDFQGVELARHYQQAASLTQGGEATDWLTQAAYLTTAFSASETETTGKKVFGGRGSKAKEVTSKNKTAYQTNSNDHEHLRML